jgi:hypothetical protein
LSCLPCTLAENGGSDRPIIEGPDPAAVHPLVSDGVPTCHSSFPNPQGICTPYFPKKVIALLQNPMAHSIPIHDTKPHPSTSFLVTDLVATNHMILENSAFISYYPVSGHRVCMGNNSFAPILGHGSAIVSLNSKKILICNCLHIPHFCSPLCSLQAHLHQRGCRFIGMFGLGMYVFSPSFILEVDTATDCHLQYEPIGPCTTLNQQLDYVQMKSSTCQSASMAAVPSPIPAIINSKTKTTKKSLPSKSLTGQRRRLPL